MWANFHTHSHYCDGIGDPLEYAQQAAATGMISLGFSSHAPVPFDCPWTMKEERFEHYLNYISSLKPKFPTLQIYTGMEVDYVPGMRSPADMRPHLDYTIGSVHFIDRFPEGKPWEIDGSHSVFTEGLEAIFKNNIQEAIARYYELTREMLAQSKPEIVGHMDKIKIQNANDKYFSETDAWYKQEVIKTLDVIAREGSIVEVNTRGLYQKKSTTPYPSPWILELIHQRNIPVTLASDAHRTQDIINQFKETASTLLSIGFKKISILKDGSWQPVTLTPDGIQ